MQEDGHTSGANLELPPRGPSRRLTGTKLRAASIPSYRSFNGINPLYTGHLVKSEDIFA